MEIDVGFVCGTCDAFAPLAASECPSCAAALGFDEVPGAPEAPLNPVSLQGFFVDSPAPLDDLPAEEPLPAIDPDLDAMLDQALPSLAEAALSTEEPPRPPVGPFKIPVRFALTEALMDQARSYVCKKCYSPVPQGHKFCGRCGEPVPRDVVTAQTLLLSKMLEPGKAKLVVIKGEGFQTDPSDETAFLLGGRQHPCGRTQGDILFDRDSWVSPLHAMFYYRDDGRLVVRDESSANGVFLRIKGMAALQPGDCFLSGEQVFRLETTPRAADGPEPDGTLFYSSPKKPSPFRVVQVLRGGVSATQVCARESAITIGRESCDMNFPNDPYMSTRHCRVELAANGAYQLVDTGSKNGTYLSIHGERELLHGDYLFIGRELLRVDISA